MNPQLGAMLLNQVVPRLQALSRSVPKVGCEDDEEIVKDATLMAARMMVSAERSGQKFSAGNMAYFAAKAARSGRRSYYTGRSDVMSTHASSPSWITTCPNGAPTSNPSTVCPSGTRTGDIDGQF